MPQYMRRREAGLYIKEKYRFSSASSLAKLATSGDGPKFHHVGRGINKIVVYEVADLDEWAISMLGEPQTSTSQRCG